MKYVWVKRRRLYRYDRYATRTQALKVAKYFQKKLRNNYFIIETEDWMSGQKVYDLYMNKVITLI